MNRLYTNTLKRHFTNNSFAKLFCTAQNRVKAAQPALPIRIPFEHQNLQHLPHIFSMATSKKELEATHQQFLKYLASNRAKGKQQFQHFQNSNKDLYDYIKQNILTGEGFASDSEFIKMSQYYFQSEGKKIRPTMVKMMADCFGKNSSQITQKIEKWGALIEMMHISSLAHDDIIDDSPSRRGVQSQHLKYGKRSAVFSANFIISKASKEVSEFNSSKLYQIYSVAMDNLATGQIIQAVTKNNINKQPKKMQAQIETYLHKTYYKTAALMANALRGVPVFFEGSTPSQEVSSFRIGQHFGIAFQLVDDIIDYTSSTEAMGKESLADIVEGNVTGPVYFSLWSEQKQGKTSKFMMNQLREKHKTKQQAEQIKKWVFANPGIEFTFALADLHIKKGLQYLKAFPKSNQHAWKELGYKILTRNK